jgi:hypothetical protein
MGLPKGGRDCPDKPTGRPGAGPGGYRAAAVTVHPSEGALQPPGGEFDVSITVR